MEITILKKHQLRCPYCRTMEDGRRFLADFEHGGGLFCRYDNFLFEQTSLESGYDIWECLTCGERFHVIE